LFSGLFASLVAVALISLICILHTYAHIVLVAIFQLYVDSETFRRDCDNMINRQFWSDTLLHTVVAGFHSCHPSNSDWACH